MDCAPRKYTLTSLHYRLILLGIIALSLFALYAGSLRLIPFHDDGVNLAAISTRSFLQMFDIKPYGTGYYRPMSFVPWKLTQLLFGWDQPTILHAWNLFCHILNTVLVGMLAFRLGWLLGNRSSALPVLTALIFGFYPFSYQSVLWAGALPHPLATLWGLFAIHAYLMSHVAGRQDKEQRTRRYLWIALSVICLVLTLLSHEQGFEFSVLIILIETVISVHSRRRPRLAIAVPCLAVTAYALVYPMIIRPSWAAISGQAPSSSLSDILSSLSYQAQGMVAWFIVLFRNQIGLPSTRQEIVLGAFAISTIVILVVLWRMRRLLFGLIALGWWAITIVPSLILLSPDYVLISPRLMYVASVGTAMVYGVLIDGLIYSTKLTILRVLLIVAISPLFIWSAQYIANWVDQVASFPNALRTAAAELPDIQQHARVLLIDPPSWLAPFSPNFLIGTESMPLFRGNMLAAVTNEPYLEKYVHHNTSTSGNAQFRYFIWGNPIDGKGVQQAILDADTVYSFQFDTPGLKLLHLGSLAPGPGNTNPIALLNRENMQVTIYNAQAYKCNDHYQLDITWGQKNVDQAMGVFIHGLDSTGKQVITADRDLMDGYLPIDAMPSGAIVTETRIIKANLPLPDVKVFSIGAYTRSDVKRLTARKADRQSWDGDAVAVPVENSSLYCR
jgi:hypothetical protein